MAEEIANLIIDKTFWGNEWFAFFSLLLVVIVSVVSAVAGTYFSMKGHNLAIRADFKKTLINIEKQTESIKNIEEEVSHQYLEKREITRIRREKIEEIYSELSREYNYFRKLLAEVMIFSDSDQFEVKENTSKVKMLISLYFSEELENDLDNYLIQRQKIISKIQKIFKNKSLISFHNTDKVLSEYEGYLENFENQKIEIESKLTSVMNKLIYNET